MASTPNPKSLAHDDYTVGWVCALDSELTAATAMLEQTHSDLPTPGDDTNAYTLGSISGHNIVIACLPIGKTGNNSAATVAVQMIRTFPSIRFGLMVGIGGGIPPNVKLGDVVVSTPTGSYPGVVQYDFGKAKDGGKFERTGALNNPPRSLLTAARKLQAEHERTGSRMPEYLDQLAQKYPRMASAYLRTDSLKDVLFEAKYSHVTKDPAADEEEDEHDDGHDAVARQGTGRSADENGFFLRIIVQWLVAMWAAWIQSVGGGIWQQPAVQNVVPQTGFATEEDDCPHCDKTRIAKMTPRVADDGDVHYGLIASGNKVVKDAMVRNRIKRSLENQALCVEMEAAGLMDNFPCMVIRGICDYADSHKNDRWQKHAAAVAAAFARELLSHVQPSDVRAESTVKHILDHIRSDVQECRENVGAIRWTLDNKEHLEILDWLTPVNYGPQHSDYFNRRQPGTGQWLLDTNEFRQWVEGRQQTLFCPGMPGSGKTMLASIVVNKLIADFRNNSDIGIAYLYCNWKDRQNTEDLISSVLKQLAQGRSTLPQTLKSLHDRHSRQKTRPSFDEILESLHSVASGYTRVFLVIDALDECQASDGCRDRLLSEMFALRAKYEANLFATSRDIPEITARFTQSMMVEVRASDGDVRRYIEGHIDRHMPPLREHIEKFPQLKEEIVTGITAAVQGMFLLAQIYLGLLNDKVTPKKVRDALAEFQGQASREGTNGKQIANAYDQTMARIMGQEQGFRDLAKGALSWITCAERPLTTVELQHALAVEQNASELSEDNFPGIKLIVSVCAGLVTVNEQNGIIRLVHYTTQEYFEQTQGTWFPEAQSDITRACICSITCLSSAFDSTVDCGSGASGFNLDAYPFAAYAVLNWGYHARKSSKLHGVVIEFLECPSEVAFFACERHQTPDPARSVLTQNRWRNSRLPAKSEREAIGQNGLHLAAAFGFHEVLHLLQHLDPNARDNFGRTPLAIAARIGQAAFAEILLKTHQPEIDSRDYGGQTPLSWAAERGHETVVRLLLATGQVDTDSKDRMGRRPLSWAAYYGYEAAIKLLLESGAEVNSKDNYGQTPLSLAAYSGSKPAVKRLLESGAEVDSKNNHGQTPLSLAAYSGSEAAIKLLLESGAEVDSKNNHSRTPLSLAAEYGYEAAVKLLLESGAEVDSKDNSGRTPLSLTTEHGHWSGVETTIKALLEGGAEVDSKDSSGRTPLSWAAERGDWSDVETMIKALLEGGAEVDSKDSSGRTPLSWAAERGYRSGVETTIKAFLEGGAEVDSKDSSGRTPLSWAAERGDWSDVETMIKALLEGGAEVDSKDSSGRTPLSLAAEHGYEAVAKLLLENGAEIDLKDAQGYAPIDWAAKGGHVAVSKLLGR